MIKALVFHMMLWISSVTGMEMPDNIPMLVQIPHENMCQMFGQEPGCPVAALYSRDHETIFLRDDRPLWNANGMSTLIHELTHHMQNKNDKVYLCAGHREKLAYDMEILYLTTIGYEDPYEIMGMDKITYHVITNCEAAR